MAGAIRSFFLRAIAGGGTEETKDGTVVEEYETFEQVNAQKFDTRV